MRQSSDCRVTTDERSLRTNTALDTKLSLRAFVQFSNVSDYAAANVRLRYNLREGNDLWLVYDEGLNLNRDRFDPVLPRTNARTVALKYTHAFVW